MNWVLVFSSVAVSLVITGTTLAAHGIKCLCVDTEDFQVIWINVIEFILASAMMVIAGGLLHVASLSPARSHTFKSLYNQLTFNRNLRTSNASVKQRFHAWITHTAKHQNLTLKEILQKSSDTVYGTDHSFHRIRTAGEFRSQHGLTDYKSYEKYVQLVLEGKDNVLFPEPVNYLSITSGTSSGRSKIFPRNSESYTNTILMSLLYVKAEMYSYPGMYSLKKLHDVRVIDPPKEIAPGVLRGPASSSSYPPWPFTASPSPVYTIATEKESLYVHAFFGLLEPDLKVLSFLTASVALNFFRMVEERWGELCDDVERGTLSMELSITDDLRRQLQCHIRPDPARAAAVREALSYGCQNMVHKLWSGCCLIKGTATGTYENSAKLLQRYIGDTPIFSPYHIATEALYGVCVNSRDSDPGVVEYTINPQANFYEFIREEDTTKEQPDTFLATEITQCL
ncbi:uncharacterized protein [Haliotis cracherodii]|uniref:uncharacterized protein n=1 Tax=Haliotis cracherodii TaxID=6455 RepID=UPI0039EA9421